MRAATVEDVAQEFMRILSEGWSPDPEEFLHRVPEELREDCRARLEELIAERDGDRPGEAEQVEEAVETFEGAEDEVIVFELDTEGPIQTVKVPSVEMPADEAEELEQAPEATVDESEQDEAADIVEASIAVAVEAALEPEDAIDLEEAETAEVEVAETIVPDPQPEIEEPETAEIEEPEAEEAEVEEPEMDDLSAEETFFSDIAAEEAPAEEPVAVAEPEPEPKPEGLVKLSREEAKAMFEAMDRARK